MSTRIKFCGITRPQDARLALERPARLFTLQILCSQQINALHSGSYAEDMVWTIMSEMAGEIEPLVHAAAEHAIQLVLCWRLSDMPEAESLLTRLHTTGVDLLPLAESCAALQE